MSENLKFTVRVRDVSLSIRMDLTSIFYFIFPLCQKSSFLSTKETPDKVIEQIEFCSSFSQQKTGDTPAFLLLFAIFQFFQQFRLDDVEGFLIRSQRHAGAKDIRQFQFGLRFIHSQIDARFIRMITLTDLFL